MASSAQGTGSGWNALPFGMVAGGVAVGWYTHSVLLGLLAGLVGAPVVVFIGVLVLGLLAGFVRSLFAGGREAFGAWCLLSMVCGGVGVGMWTGSWLMGAVTGVLVVPALFICVPLPIGSAPSPRLPAQPVAAAAPVTAAVSDVDAQILARITEELLAQYPTTPRWDLERSSAAVVDGGAQRS